MRNTVLIWAWWTWMSGVAWILHDLWYWENLICLDSTESELTQKLKSKWLKVIIWDGQYLPKITDNVIYSEACVNSPEVQKAKSYTRKPKENRFIWNYFDFLWEVSKYFNTIWITGTNWKSTTTSLAIHTAKEHLEDFWLGILWALVPDLDNNNYYVNSDKKSDIKNIFDQILNWKWLNTNLIKKYTFILEACEYKRHFLKLDIDYWIITNIELDHTDYYKDIDDYNYAFQQFTDRTKNKIFTTEILDIKSEKIQKIETQDFDFKYIFWTHNNKNWSLILNLIQELNTKTNTIKHPSLIKKGKGVDLWIKNTIQNFRWLRRRLEQLSTKDWKLIFSDYGHMASSIKVCYDAIKEKYPDKKIITIFQPHQINRILRERDEFSAALKLFDNIYIYDIYAARENLQEQLSNFKNRNTQNINSIAELWNLFAKECGWQYITKINNIFDIINSQKNDSIIIFFSAGDLDYLIRNKI